MTTCCKCGNGLTREGDTECADEDTQMSEAAAYQECLERQLSNLRALLRSQTLKLEKIREAFGDDGTTYLDAEDVSYLAGRLDQVLEALS